MMKRKLLSVLVGQAFGAAVATTVALPALAQETPAAEAQDVGAAAPAPAPTQRVTITGSSIKRTLEDQALPVTIMTREDIDRGGFINLEQLVQSISSSQSAGATTGAAMAGTSTYGESTVSLRGLGANRTLVLVNGRRLSPFANDGSGAVDVNMIPMAAVERVEVLTDGASSIYGSDAVAGVINFILRENFQGAEASYEEGAPSRSGGGRSTKYSATFGMGSLSDDGYNATLTFSKRKETALFAKDREFSKSGNQFPYLINGATPSGRIEGVWNTALSPSANDASDTNPYGISSKGYGNPGADMAGGCAAMNMFPVSSTSRAPSTGTNCNYDSAPDVGLFPDSTNESFLGSMKVKLSASAQAFGELMWNRSKLTEAYQPSPVRAGFLTTDTAFDGTSVAPALLITPSNPYYPSAWLNSHGLSAMDGNTLAVTLRAFMMGPRTEVDTNEQTRVVLGVKGAINDWDYEVALNHDKNTSEGTVTNGYFSQYKLAEIINTVGNTPGTYWNPWAAGGVQNAGLQSALSDALYVGPTASSKYTTTGLDAKISGTIVELPGGPLATAVGAQVRKEEYRVSVPDILGSGDIAGLGGATLSQTGTRTVSSVFTETSVPILSKLETTAAVRVDNYDDLKSQATPITGKLSARYTPIKALALRGSLGTGFRAPSLPELHRPQSVGTSEQFIDPADPSSGPIQANALTGGNQNLKPEKSEQQSLGLVFSPTRQISARMDYWRIKIKDMILAPSALAQVNAARAGGYLFHPGEVSFNPDGSVDRVDETLQNAGTAKFEGIDFGTHWRDKFSFGVLSADYSATYMTKADLTTLAGTEHSIGTLVDANGVPLTLTGSGVILRYKHTITLNWSIADFSVTLAENYNSGYETAPNQVDGARHFTHAYDTYDGQIEYSGIKNVRLAIGARNMTDRNPQTYIPTANNFQYGYDPSLYDPRGRFIYAKLTMKL